MRDNDTEQEYYRIASSLFSQRRDGDWRRYVRHVMPTLMTAAELGDLPDDGFPKRICSRARTGVLKLASAHTTMITPRGVKWFSYDAGNEPTEDEKRWFKDCTQIAQKELEISNFYPASIAMTIDRVATGTGLLLVEGDSRQNRLVFNHIPAGTYALAENSDHEIDTVVRKFKYSAHQCAQAFGEENLTPNMKTILHDKSRKYQADMFEVWHLITPRDIAPRGNARPDSDPLTMPYASVYIAAADQKVLWEGGCEEFPYMASRFLKIGHQVYGESALANIVDTIEDMLVLEESLKIMGQAAAVPRILVGADMADAIDMRAGGLTIMKDESLKRNLPREWAASGRFDVGLNLMEMYKQEIDDALYVTMLQTVSQVDRQMTATEAQIRENEKLMTFGQSFTQFTADFRPLMTRIFCLLVRMGKFDLDHAPDGLLAPIGPKGEEIKVLSPNVTYIGRLAKALESGKTQGLIEALAQSVQMMQATQDPSWMDFFKPYDCVSFITDEGNVPRECIRTPKEAKKLRQEREAAMAAQQQAAVEQQQAAAFADRAQGAATLNNMP